LYIKEGTINPDAFSDWFMEWKETFDPEIARSLTRGATYTPTINAIQLQKFSSDEGKILVVVSSEEN